MRKKTGIHIVFFAVTLFLIAFTGAFEFVPNYLSIGADLGLFIALYTVPVAYLLHGVMSGCLIVFGLSKRTYIITTVPLTVLAVAVCGFIAGGVSTEMLGANILRGSVYSALSLLGAIMLFCVHRICKSLHEGYAEYNKRREDRGRSGVAQ